ncbi:MAG: 4Fe-4S dicluster domain-containing protein [Chitinivibrionales bacterium]|nr:4Fe-4S dicluster domain-containing protein [Chitinivibrionales bacterium]
MVRVDHDACDHCGACISVCRTAALRLTDRLEIDGERCTSCGICTKVCAVAALTLECVGTQGEGQR